MRVYVLSRARNNEILEFQRQNWPLCEIFFSNPKKKYNIAASGADWCVRYLSLNRGVDWITDYTLEEKKSWERQNAKHYRLRIVDFRACRNELIIKFKSGSWDILHCAFSDDIASFLQHDKNFGNCFLTTGDWHEADSAVKAQFQMIHGKCWRLVAALTGNERFKECLVTLHGETYTGTANVTSEKQPCYPWSSPLIPYSNLIDYGRPVDHFPDSVEDLVSLSNYCRNPTDLGDKTDSTRELMTLPWCYSKVAYSIMTGHVCDIPYCRGKRLFFHMTCDILLFSIRLR